MNITSFKIIIAINIAYAFLIASAAFSPLEPLRILFGVPGLSFFPGCVLILALFPGKDTFGTGERMILSVALSAAVTALIGLSLEYTSGGLKLYPMLVALWLFVIAASLLAYYRAGRLPDEQRFDLQLTWKPCVQNLLLAGVLLLAYGLTFIPHLNYNYPLHVDEWMHLAYARNIQTGGNALVVPDYEFPDFASGEIMMRAGDVEPGFHVLLAMFQRVTNVPWMVIFRFFPGAIFMMVVLAVYTVAQRWGYGIEAAFLAALVPTNVTALGPSLLVPSSLGLLYLPICLFLVLYKRTKESYLMLAIIFSFLALTHLPSAMIIFLILIPFLIWQGAHDRRYSLTAGASMLIPALAFSLPVIKIAPEFARSFLEFARLPDYLPYLPGPAALWGYAPVVLFVIGVFLLGRKGGGLNIALLAACLLLLLHNLVFVYWHAGVQIIYHRSPAYLTLLMSLAGGYALYRLRSQNFTGKFKALSRRVKRPALITGIAAVIIIEAFFIHIRTPFYHMIDDEDYKAFAWIQQNLPASDAKAVLDPWKATAFMALSGRDVYSRIQHAPKPSDNLANDFLFSGARDTAFLTDNGISIVYSWTEVENSELIEVWKDVYILPESARAALRR